MSSPKAAAKTAHKPAPRAAPKAALKGTPKAAQRPKPAARGTTKSIARPTGGASEVALRLASDIEASLAEGQLELLAPEALQALLGAACKAYAARIEGGHPVAALAQRTTVTPTEVMITASGLLRAANLAVFELGMWQSWTGR
jgi:hypothetical protein